MSLDILEMLYYCFIIIIFNILGIYLEIGINNGKLCMLNCACVHLGSCIGTKLLNVAIGFS